MQTALHIQTVVSEARRELIGAEFYSAEFYRKERAAYLFFSSAKKKFAVGLQFHPLAHGALFVPAGKIRYETSEKPFPFFQGCYGTSVVAVEQMVRVASAQQDYFYIHIDGLGLERRPPRRGGLLGPSDLDAPGSQRSDQYGPGARLAKQVVGVQNKVTAVGA